MVEYAAAVPSAPRVYGQTRVGLCPALASRLCQVMNRGTSTTVLQCRALAPASDPADRNGEISGKGHCKLGPQGQRAGDRRQALRRAQSGEHPSRQGNAGDAPGDAPHFRRRQGNGALPHDRTGGARLSR